MAEQLLSGIKVLDLTWHIAGPSCTKLLADYGADVLKVERPGVGDPSRSIPPFLNDEFHLEKSILFHHNNLNKRSITLDLKSDVGKDIVKRLVADADILVENFSPGVIDRLGLSPAVLEKVNPRLVMVSISNYGSTGPYRDFKASNLILDGIAKDQYSNGMDGREPVMMVARDGNVYMCGYMAAIATLSAYWHASEKGIGQWLDLSMQEMLTCDTNCVTIYMVNWAMNGRITPRRDPRSTVSTILPNNVQVCKDGFVDLSSAWERFRALVASRPELAELKAFLDTLQYPRDAYNFDNKPMVDAYWIPWCLDHTKQEIMEAAQEVGLFCTAIKTPKEALDDPQLASRHYWVKVDHPVVGEQTHCGPSIDVYEAPWAITRPVPLLGQHNEEVYCGQLGYSREDLAIWRGQGII